MFSNCCSWCVLLSNFLWFTAPDEITVWHATELAATASLLLRIGEGETKDWTVGEVGKSALTFYWNWDILILGIHVPDKPPCYIFYLTTIIAHLCIHCLQGKWHITVTEWSFSTTTLMPWIQLMKEWKKTKNCWEKRGFCLTKTSL